MLDVDDYGLSEIDSSDEEGEGMFAYHGQQQTRAPKELAALSEIVDSQPFFLSGQRKLC